MNAVFDSIVENLREIKIVMEPTPGSFTGDRIQTGNGREYTLQEFVSKYFPSTYSTKKGPIHSMSGRSNEIDCVLLAPNHPQLITSIGREVIIAEGVHAAIELKPDISTLTSDSEFARGLNQLKSVKRLNRDIFPMSPLPGELPLPKRANQIPTFLFSFNSAPVEKTLDFIEELLKTKEYELSDIPDFIVTLDNGIICFTEEASKSMFRGVKSSHKVQEEIFFVHYEMNNMETRLALFLLSLINVTPPEPVIADHILRKYLNDAVAEYKCMFYTF